MTLSYLGGLKDFFQLNDVVVADALEYRHLPVNQLENFLTLNLQHRPTSVLCGLSFKRS